jgi:hypothetical protein
MPGGEAGVNARDRIGKRPWHNATGVMIGMSIDDELKASSGVGLLYCFVAT